jgi:hypothetical protein
MVVKERENWKIINFMLLRLMNRWIPLSLMNLKIRIHSGSLDESSLYCHYLCGKEVGEEPG